MCAAGAGASAEPVPVATLPLSAVLGFVPAALRVELLVLDDPAPLFDDAHAAAFVAARVDHVAVGCQELREPTDEGGDADDAPLWVVPARAPAALTEPRRNCSRIVRWLRRLGFALLRCHAWRAPAELRCLLVRPPVAASAAPGDDGSALAALANPEWMPMPVIPSERELAAAYADHPLGRRGLTAPELVATLAVPPARRLGRPVPLQGPLEPWRRDGRLAGAPLACATGPAAVSLAAWYRCVGRTRTQRGGQWWRAGAPMHANPACDALRKNASATIAGCRPPPPSAPPLA